MYVAGAGSSLTDIYIYSVYIESMYTYMYVAGAGSSLTDTTGIAAKQRRP